MDKKKILIVDDEPELVEMLRMRLEASDYEVVSANDGEEGLQKTKSEKPDLVVLDIMMPKKDGYTFVKEMKTDKTTKHIPVIVLTAKTKMQDLFEMEGVKDYVVKPFESKELLAKIATHFNAEEKK